ncbi:hypothetical protein HN51_063514 [Arachis hypogaea]
MLNPFYWWFCCDDDPLFHQTTIGNKVRSVLAGFLEGSEGPRFLSNLLPTQHGLCTEFHLVWVAYNESAWLLCNTVDNSINICRLITTLNPNAIKMTTTTDAAAAASSEAQLLKTVTTILTSHPDPHSALKLLIQNLTHPTVLSVLSSTQLHRTHSATLLSFFHIFRHSPHPSLSSPLSPSSPSSPASSSTAATPPPTPSSSTSSPPTTPATPSTSSSSAAPLFNKMKRLRIKPNLLTCHSLISSLVRRHPHSSHTIHLSKQVFNDSLKLGITPNTTAFNILIHGSCLDNNFNNALSFMNQMTDFTCSPNNITYNTILDA